MGLPSHTPPSSRVSLSKRTTSTLVLLLSIAAAGAFAACGSDSGSTVGGGNTLNGGSGGQSDGGPGGSAGDGGTAGSLNLDSSSPLTLSIEPQNPVLNVSGSPASQGFTAKLSDGTSATANWLLDDVVLGTIDATGTFTSGGFIAGSVGVTARVGDLEASTTLRVVVDITDNAAGVPDTDRGLLDAGGGADSAFKWLYPYDKTIFPRGLSGPEMQFGGSAADAMRVEVSFSDFSYVGYFGASNPNRVTLPPNVWEAITKSAGAGVDVQVKASKLSAGAATGPVNEDWRIAQGSLKGIIYYNTYRSASTNTGAVMRVRPGGAAEVMIGQCTVCHSVSSQGNVLVGGLNWGNGNPLDSGSFDLTPDGNATPRYTDDDGRKLAFGGLTPDGALMLSNGVPTSGPAIRGLSGDYPSRLYDTKTGAQVSAPTFESQVQYAMTPAFAPDSTKVAFSWHEQNAGKTLAVMSFDGTQTPPVFGTPSPVVSSSQVVGWPSFTPDSQAVLFHEGDAYDTGNANTHAFAEIRLVDLQSQAVSALSALNGYEPSGASYLPYGETEEGRLNYEPTVLPVPVGGYYWVVFTSRRAYGNIVAPGGTEPGGDNKWGTNDANGETPSPRKKLWIAAVDIDYQGKLDPSHPAFYLPGQELSAGNMRAFTALEPCKAEGASCESGAECCDGFCRQAGSDDAGAPVFQCVPPPTGCSNEDESCTTAADCCGVSSGYLCINGRCARPTPH
ncbi:MAG: dickkopf-related protein [Polyangiaceae bacterium]